ncbi:MAG TPA: hypothetical protein VNC59_03165 [Thermoanaerobaculia bacterium]|nr:hypothetical protein [Thermoanaerobaculia bacterium]
MGAEGEFLALLRRTDLGPAELERILRDPQARRFHAVRLALASHRLTPRSEALSLVETLFSYDLAHLSADVRAPSEVRRAADRLLLRRTGEMALAERMHLARTAGRGMLPALRHDPDPRVVAALLDNRFATEADVLGALGPRAHPETIAAVASHPRWSVRRPVREALLAHPRLSEGALEGLLARATDEDLSLWGDSPGAAAGVRAASQRILARRRKGD